jgi:hypothetical protein
MKGARRHDVPLACHREILRPGDNMNMLPLPSEGAAKPYVRMAFARYISFFLFGAVLSSKFEAVIAGREACRALVAQMAQSDEKREDKAAAANKLFSDQ